jgi:rhodanese-related sulfurtransferase
MLKKILLISVLFIASMLLSGTADALLYEDMTAYELEQRIEDKEDKGYILVDVRPLEDYEEGHIPESINIPLKELGYRLYALDRTKDIIVYCGYGLQSKIAAQVLANAGFKDVYNLVDGTEAWPYAIVTNYGSVTI